MGYKYQGDAVMYASLTVEAPRPLDIRTVVDGIENLYNIPSSSAYQGMVVANINDGNLYMLIDKNKITEKAGWKASYESIQIITCTQEEYDTWAENTTEDYRPNDSSLSYLRRDVYYYIYENEESSQYYVTKKQIEDWLSAKASVTIVEGLSKIIDGYKQDLTNIQNSVTNITTDITNNYITALKISEVYATKQSLNTVDDKFINYYTQEQIADLLKDYVTKNSLKGDITEEGEEDFVFVTQSQYDADKNASLEEITTKALTIFTKIEGEDDIFNTITATKDAVLVGNKELAFKEIIPKIEIVETKEAFDAKPDKDPETYYYIIDDKILGYITYNEATATFYTKGEVNDMISKAKTDTIQTVLTDYIIPLQEKIAALEIPQV